MVVVPQKFHNIFVKSSSKEKTKSLRGTKGAHLVLSLVGLIRSSQQQNRAFLPIKD
jgi:hypothetical protein